MRINRKNINGHQDNFLLKLVENCKGGKIKEANGCYIVSASVLPILKMAGFSSLQINLPGEINILCLDPMLDGSWIFFQINGGEVQGDFFTVEDVSNAVFVKDFDTVTYPGKIAYKAIGDFEWNIIGVESFFADLSDDELARIINDKIVCRLMDTKPRICLEMF